MEDLEQKRCDEVYPAKARGEGWSEENVLAGKETRSEERKRKDIHFHSGFGSVAGMLGVEEVSTG